MKARAQVKKVPTKPRRVPKAPPIDPLIQRGSDGKLVKTKVVYSSGPKMKKIVDINSAWCGIPTYQSTIACNFEISRLDTYTDAIIMAVNQKSGVIPTSNQSWNFGKLRIYLLSAVYSHLSKLGSISTDTMKWLKYGKYRVPTSFALALQDLGTFKHPDTGACFTPTFPALTESYYSSIVSTEGSTVCPVIIGNSSSFGDEPYFGNGVNVLSIDDIDCDIISEIISSHLESVQVQYVSKYATSASALLYDCGNFTCMVPHEVSNITYFLSLSTATTRIGPCLFIPPCEVVGLQSKTHNNSTGFLHTHVLLCMNLPYEYKQKLWVGFSKFGVDPYQVQLMEPVMSFSALAGIILDWLVMNGFLVSNTAAQDSTFVNWLNIIYAYLLAKTPFPGRVHSNANQAPFYVSPSHLRVGVPTMIGNFGMQATRAGNTIIIPSWPTWSASRNCMNTCISGNVYTPAFSDASGALPLNGTIPSGVLIGGLSPPDASRVYNACYLAIKEELQLIERINANGQTVEFDLNKPYCPCAVSYDIGTNDEVGGFVALPMTSIMVCYRAVGSVECKAQMALTLDIRPALSSYYKSVSDATQNRYRIVSEAARFGNNVTQLVATNSGAAWKQASTGYYANLASRVDWERALVTGADVIKAANYYIQSGGALEGLPDASFWNSITSKDFNLEELISKVASGIAYVTPAVRSALAAYKAIRIHYPSN